MIAQQEPPQRPCISALPSLRKRGVRIPGSGEEGLCGTLQGTAFPCWCPPVESSMPLLMTPQSDPPSGILTHSGLNTRRRTDGSPTHDQCCLKTHTQKDLACPRPSIKACCILCTPWEDELERVGHEDRASPRGSLNPRIQHGTPHVPVLHPRSVTGLGMF